MSRFPVAGFSDFPYLPFFQHEVCGSSCWAPCSEAVRAAVLNPEYSRNLLLEQVIPEVSHAVYNSRDSLHNKAQHGDAALQVCLAKADECVATVTTSFSHSMSSGQLSLTIR